jgi:hypothetical protein
LLIPATATVLVFALIFFGQSLMMFHPNHDPQSLAYLQERPAFEVVEIKSNGKSYHGILRRNTSQEPSPLIIFFYGNADNASRTMRAMDEFGMWFYFRDFHCLIVDYPGYGPGRKSRPSATNMYEMSLSAFDYARSLPEVSRIIIGGFSIGTGPAVYLAAHRDVDGLFLLAPFANGYDLCNSVLPIFHGPLRLLVRNPFPSDEYAKKVAAPTLLVASRADEIISFRSSERLERHFAGETTFIALNNLRHNEIFFNTTALNNIRQFLEKF